MIKQKKNPNFEDQRGTITDIFVKEPKEYCTIIFTKKGGVRGNHLHKETTQYDFLVYGKMETYGQKDGGLVDKELWLPNEYLTWEPNEAHEFVALEDSVFITFGIGTRSGEDFEKDTIRLPKPLHELFLGQK